MSDKIYDLYKTYRNQPLDDKFIYQAFEIMLEKEKGLIPYIDDFRVIDTEFNALGTYSNEDRLIKINKSLIAKQSIQSQIYALHVIRHELEHARNLKTLYEGRRDIESLAVYYSLRSYAMEHNMDYFPNLDHLYKDFLEISTKINYETDPGERLAEIKACKYIVNLLKNQRNTEDLLVARSMLYYSYIRGYKDNRYYLDPPTYEFLIKTGMYHNFNWLKEQVNKKDYSFETRITYGLPITGKEYNEKVLQKVKLRKRNYIINERRTDHD